MRHDFPSQLVRLWHALSFICYSMMENWQLKDLDNPVPSFANDRAVGKVSWAEPLEDLYHDQRFVLQIKLGIGLQLLWPTLEKLFLLRMMAPKIMTNKDANNWSWNIDKFATVSWQLICLQTCQVQTSFVKTLSPFGTDPSSAAKRVL